MKEIVLPGDGVVPYSRAIRAGDLIFVSGHLAWGADGEVIHGSIEQETRQVWSNIRDTLAEMDCTLQDIVKATIWLQDTRDFNGYNKAYAEFFPHDPPTRSTVRADLMFDAKIEIEVVVYKPVAG